MSDHPRSVSSVLATCPECGLGARVSGRETRVDDDRCELLTGCTPLSCTHFTSAVAAAQEILRKVSASQVKRRAGRGERETPSAIH
jgi:hypothetical protein